jgi:hypothetical protein
VLPYAASDDGRGRDAPAPRQDTVAAAAEEERPVRDAQDETSGVELILPVALVGAAGLTAGYAWLRRSRRHRTRTTPGGAPTARTAAAVPEDLDERTRAGLVLADDCVRTSRAELDWVRERFGPAAVAALEQAVRDADTELTAAFRIRRQYDEGVPEAPEARRHALAGIMGRCEEAGRRLDAAAPALDRLRAGQGIAEALALAESRFRAQTARTAAVDALLAELDARWSPSATEEVTGYADQAKDRLVFATLRLNACHQSTDLGQPARAARHLRAAEGAVAQAAVLLDEVEALGTRLAEAAALVPAALSGAEAALARARQRPSAEPDGSLRARLLQADNALAAVRERMTEGPWDPRAALRSITRVSAPLCADPTAGVLGTAAVRTARGAVASADAFVSTHRGVVGAAARTLLAEARRLLDEDPLVADGLALRARDQAEQDVRAQGAPLTSLGSGVAGALQGGVLLTPDLPAAFGGPESRTRLAREENGDPNA